MNESNQRNIKKEVVAEALQVLPKAYDDLLKPTAQELGKGLETIAKTLNIVLSPLSGMVWGFDRLKKYLSEDVSRRLEARGTKKITTPPPSVAVPTLSALTYLGSETELRNLFTNLLVSATDAKSTNLVHPAFVEIIKQLSADEAKILSSLKKIKYFPVICEGTYSDGDHHDAHSMLSEIYKDFNSVCREAGVKEDIGTDHYLDNLLRLRLFEVKEVGDVELKRRHSWFSGEDDSDFEIERSRYEALYVSRLGLRFLDICVYPADVEPGA